ncbi:GNAT family N-acetyltransferase [Bradyrhizobium cytisi]|uniref:GNAT family N-acetyltransferase n=1 Tax=Bradyrhizobium cytisi TaxID=515489 RepID=UPI0016532C37|nr:GNAT family N-acetyltransferase [Bradyrhizobium cytisi]
MDAIAGMARAFRSELGDPPGKLTAGAIRRDAMGSHPRLRILVADLGGTIVGYALYQNFYEPGEALEGVHLCDLYVTPAERKSGFGRALLDGVSDAARADKKAFVWWVTRQSNQAAMEFYQHMGAITVPALSCGIILS